ncbi:hypothetical protein Manayef4_09025 [Frankia sp. CgMI4]|nr:hypothetical protein Manayef4_09025 [Frankia sp. CgIM4]
MTLDALTARLARLETAIDDHDAAFSDLTSTPTAPAGSADSRGQEQQEQADPLYPDVVAFVEQFFAPAFARPLGGEFRWCPHWWDHTEAGLILEACWRTFEHFRLNPQTGISELAVAGVPAAAAGLDVEDLPYLPDDPEHAATGTQGAAPALAGPAEPVRYALSRSATTAPLVLTENDVEIARVRIDPGRASTENRQMLRDWVSLHTGQPAPPVDWLQLRRGRWEFDAPAPAAGPTAGPRGQLLVSADGGQSWVLYGVGTPRADADPHRVAESVVAHEIARLRGQVGDDAALLVRCEMYSPDRQIVAVDSRDLRGDVNATAAGTVPAEGQDPPRYRGELYGPDRALRRTYEHPAEPRPAPARPPAVAGLLGAAFPPTRAGVTPASPPSPSDSAASTIPASPTIPGRPPHTGR